VTRELSARLENAHGLTLSDFDVLVQLFHAEGNRLRRVDLARSVILTASGITRLLDGLERAGWVEKQRCESDARVTYAALTTDSSPAVAALNPRMPVILAPRDYERWLEGSIEDVIAPNGGLSIQGRWPTATRRYGRSMIECRSCCTPTKMSNGCGDRSKISSPSRSAAFPMTSSRYSPQVSFG